MQVGSVETQTAEVSTDNHGRDFVIPSLENAWEAVLAIFTITLSVTRSGGVTFVNSMGLIKVPPANAI